MSATTYSIEDLQIAPGVLVWGVADIKWSASDGSDWRVTDITVGFHHEGAETRVLTKGEPLFAMIREALETIDAEHIANLIAQDMGDDYVAPRSDFAEHNTLGM